MEICSSYRCAVIQDQCTAALVRAKWRPHCSVLLCKLASQHACATASTPMEIGSSYMCAVMQHQSTAALVKVEQLSHCSVLLCKKSSQQALCHCKCNLGDLLFIHVCRDATPKHCSTGQGRIASTLFSAALQNRLTARLCHCNHTYGDLLFIQVCSDATLIRCSTGQGKIASPLFSVALQKELTACSVSLQLYLKLHSPLFSAALQDRLPAGLRAGLCLCNDTYGDMLFILICGDPTLMYCNTGQGNLHSPLFSAALQNRHKAGLCL